MATRKPLINNSGVIAEAPVTDVLAVLGAVVVDASGTSYLPLLTTANELTAIFTADGNPILVPT